MPLVVPKEHIMRHLAACLTVLIGISTGKQAHAGFFRVFAKQPSE